MTKHTKQVHRFRSVVALVLALTIVLSAAPMAYASQQGTEGAAGTAMSSGSGSCGEGVEWSLTGGHLTISGKGRMTNFTDENLPPWFASAQTITKVSVGAGVTRIGSLAFYGCKNLTSVGLPEGLTRIGDRAFKECVKLPTVVFPSTLTHIGEAAFESCESLYGIRLPEGLRTIRDYAFYRCYGLTTITVPASVTSFGMVVFAYCENLTQATILCPMERVPDWTFYGCSKLAQVTLPETATASGEYAFHDCGKLETIHYTGEAAKEIMDDIREDESSFSTGGTITNAPPVDMGGGSSAVSSDFTLNDEGTLTTTDSTAVTETENSIITKVETTESTFTVNGEPASVQDVANATAEDEVKSESITTTTITATITKDEGWDELNTEIDSALQGIDTETDELEVIVHTPDNKVKGDDLATLAGKDVTVSIITPESDVWEIDGKTVTTEAVSGNSYDFGLTVTEVKADKIGVDCTALFKLKFAKAVNFPVTVGVRVSNAYQMATLYEKSGGKYEEKGTVIVDRSGMAWLTFDEISKKGEYYVAINVAGKTQQDAVIPKTLYSEYGLSGSLATLMDAEGNLYEVTGNASKWGITAKQFGIYAAVAVGAAIVIVSVTMYVWNRLKRNKAKYRAMAQADAEEEYPDDWDDEPIDEEALRLEIMRELLSEMDNNK